MAFVLGVDPGLSGGLALMHPKGGPIWVEDMPTMRIGEGKSQRRDYDLAECWALARSAAEFSGSWAPDAGPLVLALEQLTPMPAMKGSSSLTNFSLGRALMLWEAIAVGMGASLERVRPKVWQSALGCASGEKAALARAREIWPQADLKLVRHSGRAAALMIAEAARRARA